MVSHRTSGNVYVEHAVQLAAYANAEYAIVGKRPVVHPGKEAWNGTLVEWGPEKAERLGIVHVRPDGVTLHTELGAAFDRAMEERIFEPLGMNATTFDYPEAMADNWARPHSRGFGGPVQPVPMDWHSMVYPYRPAGGAWSTAHDMALYVLNELREGKLADGSTFVSSENLLKRREHNVPIGDNAWYGMGLMEDASKGKSIFDHGGSLLGYKSDFWFIPEDRIGAVLLTNSDTGQTLLGLLKRKLLEVLYDGNEEAPV